MARILAFALLCLVPTLSQADENLFGYVKGAETLPQGSWELYQVFTHRSDKGKGEYRALDSRTELEYGVTNRFTVSAELKALAVRAHNLYVSAYIPKDIDLGFRPSGLEGAMKYNILSPAKDDFGLAPYFSLSYSWRDPHSGQLKDTYSAETFLLLQKYFLEGELIWVGNFGIEATHAERASLNNLPTGIEWPDHPEMEIALISSMGLSYRFIPSWYIGAEVIHESEFETEVGQERWSIFAGPSLHYGGQKWWGTLTYLPQLRGGGFEAIEGQNDQDLHLIEKTKREIRLKLGFNF